MKERRSRIKENFTEEDLQFIKDLANSPYFDNNNDKARVLLQHFGPKGFIQLAPGTNRFGMLKGEYVYKLAMDSNGIRDNWNEFNMCMKLQPYVIKVYECNGLVEVTEYVTIMDKPTFEASKETIRNILSVITEDFLIGDAGTITKNYCNWGFDDDNVLKLLDFGYTFDKDPAIMYCPKCGGKLTYDMDYDHLYCQQCATKVSIMDIWYRMLLPEDAFNQFEEIDGPLEIELVGMPNT